MIKKAIFVKKLGMSQLISVSGDVEAVTVLKLVESDLMYKISSEKCRDAVGAATDPSISAKGV